MLTCINHINKIVLTDEIIMVIVRLSHNLGVILQKRISNEEGAQVLPIGIPTG